ncbi:hypothetical protein CSB90_3963 [Pseudomonas aeruginosa]|nr:hypothetical protein CSB90_3963 [Pseudomonas aeruginosa]
MPDVAASGDFLNMLMLQKNELYRASISVFLLMYPRTT